MELLLTSLLLLPFLGAAVGAALRSGKAARNWALFVSLATAALALVLTCYFFNTPDVPHAKPISSHYRIAFLQSTVDQKLTLSTLGFSLNLGVDAISLWLVILTAFLMPLSIAASFGSIKDREREYYAWMTMLLGAMIGVFLARDALLFYIFFELTLIPMFFIIGIWGGPERRYAAGKFFLFTFAGSVFTLAALVYLAMRANPDTGGVSFDIRDIIYFAQHSLSSTERFWVVLGILAGLAVKVPLFPVHTWLPLAHTEAPTAGSVILAGVLLKLGTYGVLRFAVPIGLISNGQVVSHGVIHAIGILCLIGIIYGALVAWVQQDIKKLVAYSSVSHLGFCILGLVALNEYGMQGSVLYMINHGLSTGALFLVVGMIYDRYHTRDIEALSGLARIMPKMAFFFILFTLSSIGLPGLNGFISEFLTILGAFTSQYLGVGYGSIAAIGIILGAVYMLHMAAKVIWGPLKFPAGDHGDQATEAEHSHAHGHVTKNDLNGREMAILIPIALAVVLLGVLPNSVLTSILGPIKAIGPAQIQNVAHEDSNKLPSPAPAPHAIAAAIAK